MMKYILQPLSVALIFSACTKVPEDSPTNTSDSNTTMPDNMHGDAHPLGRLEAFGRGINVVQLGDVEAGKEAAVELEFASGKERLTTVRGWIGIETGEGSMKSPLMIEGKANMHGHLEVPKAIPAGSKIWLDFELDGKHETYSIAYQ